MFDRELFDEARREFLSHLRYAKGHSPTTCYNYNSDLGIWGQWLIEAGKDWQTARYPDVEQFSAWQMRERSAEGVHRQPAPECAVVVLPLAGEKRGGRV